MGEEDLVDALGLLGKEIEVAPPPQFDQVRLEDAVLVRAGSDGGQCGQGEATALAVKVAGGDGTSR